MNKKVIRITNIPENKGIGHNFNHLFRIISETDAEKSVLWDFRDANSLHPFFVAPLAIYKSTSGKDIECVNMSLRLQYYLNSICFNRILHFENDAREEVETVLETYLDKSHVPLCSFAMTDANRDIFGTIIQRVILKQTGFKGGSSSLGYLISELFDNIYEHSHSKNGYVFSQYSPDKEAIDICIADTGVTIPGSFRQASLYQKEIDGNDSEALRLANEGYSTKNRPEAENRGYGISTSKQMLVVGMKGAFFMLSGGAFHRYENGKNEYIDLSDVFKWKGTIIFLHIPVNTPSDFHYIDYLE